MRRSVLYLVSMLVLSVLLGACQVQGADLAATSGDGMASDGPTNIVLMRFFGDCFDEFGTNADLSAAYGECGIIQTLTNAFNESQDEVFVETQVVDWPGFAELNSNLAANTPPDIMVLHGFRISNYASRGLLTPLDEGFETVGIDVADFSDTALENVSYNGEIFGLPLDLHGHIWHINLGLWAEAGLVDDDGAPMLPVGETEFLAAAEQFTAATGLPFTGMWTNGLSRNWMALVYQQGGAIEDGDGLPVVDTAEGLAALNFLIKLRDEGHITDNVDYTASQEIFLNGENGSHVNGTWVVNFYDEQTKDEESGLKDYYVASFPQIFDQPAAWAATHSWIIPQGNDGDPAKINATLKFFKYLNDNNLQWARTGHATVLKSVLESAEYNELAHRNEYASFVSDSVGVPRRNWTTAFETVLDEELTAALLGDKSPAEALAAAQSRLTDFAQFGGE
ncbi:MAG: extracellular solute-binding protein [Chloroflexota bacterium]